MSKSQIQQIENLNVFFSIFLKISHDFILKKFLTVTLSAFNVFVHKVPNVVENVTYNKLFHVTTSLICNGIQTSRSFSGIVFQS